MTARDHQRCARPARLTVVVIAMLLSHAAAAAAGTGTVWIEWDRSPDPSVIGYKVSVGTAPGVYTETFDVGSGTAFVYEAADDTRLFYLAVAAYAPGPTVGPLSLPISAFPLPAIRAAVPGDVPTATDARAFYEALWRSPIAGHHSSSRADGESGETAFGGAAPVAGRWRTRITELLVASPAMARTPRSECEVMDHADRPDSSVVRYGFSTAVNGELLAIFTVPSALAPEVCNLLVTGKHDSDPTAVLQLLAAQ